MLSSGVFGEDAPMVAAKTLPFVVKRGSVKSDCIIVQIAIMARRRLNEDNKECWVNAKRGFGGIAIWAAVVFCAITLFALTGGPVEFVGKAVASTTSSSAPSGLASDELMQEDEPEFVVRADGLSTNPAKALENSLYLQRVMDTLSKGGGGTISVPAGVYRFAATGKHSLGDYALEARNNVKIVGAGEGKTVFKPVGIWAETGLYEHGVDMFAYTGMKSGEYLVNADFEGFTIDGSETQGSPDGYNASGKGFFFKLFRDCDWVNVTVMNTDGTGFGMDFPISSTVVNCTAVGCGKNATKTDAGASGFGIGTGYSGRESMEIIDCESYDNTKYGFFFEHQTRFNSRAEALRAKGFSVSGCVASGNLYNFGGARAHDVTYEGCVSAVSKSALREGYTERAFCFENHSYRIRVVDCSVEQGYADVPETAPYYHSVQWALDEGLLEAATDVGGEMLFYPEAEMLRSEVASLLWRYAGRPGDVVFSGEPEMPDDYADVGSLDYYIDAALWMGSLGDVPLAEYRGKDPVTRAELITMIWRMAGKPQVQRLPGFVDVDKDAYYAPALAWAAAQGFIPSGSLEFCPANTCERAEVVALLQAFDDFMKKGLVGVIPDEVDMLADLDLKKALGDTLLPRMAYVHDIDEEDIR